MQSRWIVLGALVLVACERPPAKPARVATAEGFQTPEAVRYDGELDRYFVASINGHPNQKDNNGFISRLTPDGQVDSLQFIAGGRDGVTLHAPKGMAIVADTLWVTDIDAVRAFNKRTGAPVATVEFGAQGARFLNDIVAGPDGALYVTDTGIFIDATGQVSHPGPDRIFRLGPDRRVAVAVQGDTLKWPNGIAWDAASSRFVVVSFGGPTILSWKPGDATPTVIATGPGGFDGVELLADGRFLVSTWADSSLYVYQDGALSSFIRGVPAPADIGLDTKRNRVAIPLFTANKVEIWDIGR